MKITLTGASGFLGGVLITRLRERGHELTVLGRRRRDDLRFFSWDSIRDPFPVEAVDGADAVIHLAGEPVAQRWNHDIKRRIRDSRVAGTRRLVEALAASRARPRVLVSASAIGFYGDRGEQILDETSRPGGGFLPEVCVEWERAALDAQGLGVRVALPRIGIVLHRDGGALATMLPPFKLGVGGPVGDGRQWMSWIHRDDMVDLLLWALDNEAVSGPVNAVSPDPARNGDFSRALGRALSRPACLPVPAFSLRLLYGEMASVVLSSQHVQPRRALDLGFPFRYPRLHDAMRAAVCE